MMNGMIFFFDCRRFIIVVGMLEDGCFYEVQSRKVSFYFGRRVCILFCYLLFYYIEVEFFFIFYLDIQDYRFGVKYYGFFIMSGYILKNLEGRDGLFDQIIFI